MKIVSCSKPGYTRITCPNIEYIPYTIISWDYLNLSLATSQYQPKSSSITNVAPDGSAKSYCRIYLNLNYD